MLPTLNYAGFRESFTKLIDFVDPFTSAKTDPKLKLGAILKSGTFGSVKTRNEYLREAVSGSNKVIPLTDNSAKSVASGTGEHELCWVFYFYLHVNFTGRVDLDELDKSILAGSTFLEKFGRSVDGKNIDANVLYKATSNKTEVYTGSFVDRDSIIKPSAPFLWPKYKLKKEVEAAELELPKGGDSAIWLSPLNHRSIPLEGRKTQWQELDDFIGGENPFNLAYVIAPSGAGKTRLVSQWMRRFVANPDDAVECPESKVDGWDAGFVHDQDHKVWEDWQPSCNTLIVIDYTYNFAEVIRVIWEKSRRNPASPRIRLLLLDHVKPSASNMRTDTSYGKGMGNRENDGTAFKYDDDQYKTIYLSPDKHSPALLGKIITRVANLFLGHQRYSETDEVVVKATDALLAIADSSTDELTTDEIRRRDAVRHPLFAALMGQALATNPDRDFMKLKRRDLIELYFEPDRRIPWRGCDQKAHTEIVGTWIGAYVSTATLLRGTEFTRLHAILPDLIDSITTRSAAINFIEGVSLRLVSSDNEDVLIPLEPDILGETFFLKFLEDRKNETAIIRQFYEMLSDFKDKEQEYRIVSGFLETIQRLVRNLINDDQTTKFVMDAWHNLSQFLNPEEFPENNLMRRATSIALGDIVGQLHKAKLDNKIIQRFADNVKYDDLECLSETGFWREVTDSTSAYFEWYLQCSRLEESATKQIHKILEQSNALSEGNWTTLMLASQTGRLEVVKYLLDKDAKTKAKNKDDLTALMIASANGHLEVVKHLLDKGAKIEAKTKDDWTALIFASLLGQLEVVKHLLESDAEIEAKNKGGWTALMFASQKGHLEVVIHLCLHGASLNACRGKGFNALMTASEAGHLEVVQYLYNKGADIYATTSDNFDALAIACNYNHIEIVKYLHAKGLDINASGKNYFTPLIFASQDGYLEIVKYLHVHGANINAVSDGGVTAMMFASQNGHLEVVKYLNANGANSNAVSDYSRSALMLASQQGHLEIVEYFCSEGANPDLIDKDGLDAMTIAHISGHLDIVCFLATRSMNEYSWLAFASYHCSLDIVQYLHVRGVNLDGRNENGLTPLLIASLQGHLDIVEYLSRNGADLNALANNDFSPIMLASQNGHLDVVKYLNTKDANLQLLTEDDANALVLASGNGHLDVVKYLHTEGVGIHCKTQNGFTAIMLSAQNGHLEIMKYLHMQGADIHDILENGVTALMLATQNGHLEVIKYLHEQGANINSVLENGGTVLILASAHGHVSIVKYLLDWEVDPTIKANDGSTAADFALSQAGNQELYNLLKQAEADWIAKHDDV